MRFVDATSTALELRGDVYNDDADTVVRRRARASDSSRFKNALTAMMRDPDATQPSIAKLNTYALQANTGTHTPHHAPFVSTVEER